MDILSENLRHLRTAKNLTQQELADKLIITRNRWAKYELGIAEPPIEILKRISRLFHISIDILVSLDLRKVELDKLFKLGDNRILFPVVVDAEDNDQIEVVPVKASAGYLNGYADPEYIESLQRMKLPFIPTGKHRAFPIKGDSMPPLQQGDYVVGKYVDDLKDLKEGRTYILITLNEGIVYKRVYQEKKELRLVSDNKVYEPYKVKLQDVMEIWEYVCSIKTGEYQKEEINLNSIMGMLRELRVEVMQLKNGPL